MLPRRAAAVLCLAAGLVSPVAAAHDADVVYVHVERASSPGPVFEIVTLTAATLGQLAPVDADGDGVLTQDDLIARADAIKQGVWADMPMTSGGVPCALDEAQAVALPGYVQLEARFVCGPGELRQDFRLLRVLPSNYRVVLGRQVDGEGGRAFAQVPTTSLVLGARERPQAPAPSEWEEATAHGLRRALRVDAALAMLLVLLLAADGRRRLALLGLLLGGLLVGSLTGLPEPLPALGLLGASAAALGLPRREPTRWWWTAALAAGLCLGLRGGLLTQAPGLFVGSAAVALLAAVLAQGGAVWARRQPRVERWLPRVLLGAVVLAVTLALFDAATS